ncbi:hypothetical protein BCR44DRAFT_35030 [Catenaria anguillulae PL171]|uniref:Ankyrin repeat-containing domain protein n=1 Tax=Catenaria anguillulae PL171 TaxID=765915 RepID=A0A1Y2HE91_9FUNG|nr:hypothetical protein BCR44DRAFT_35030 [Catenaria anguillulae PL171]
MDSPPCLPNELIDPLLAAATVLTLSRSDPLNDQHHTHLYALATVLPRNSVTLLTSTVLNRYATWITLDTASASGDVCLLNRLVRLSRSHRRPLQYTSEAITFGGSQGCVKVLDWWFDCSGLLFHWTSDAIDQAAAHGHVSILDWWAARCQSGQVPLSAVKYSTEAITRAILNNHMAVLHWWSSPNVGPFKPKVHSFTATIAAVSSLNWAAIEWLESRSLASYHTQTLGHACRTGHLDMITHVHNRLQSVEENQGAVHRVDLIKWRPVNEDNPFWIATECGHVHVLDWLVDSGGYVPEWSGGWRYLDAAVASGDTMACEWWVERFGAGVSSAADLKSALARACESGSVAMAAWIFGKCEDPERCLSSALSLALVKVCANGHVDILNWVMEEEAHLMFACATNSQQLTLMLNGASANGCVEVLEWFDNFNLFTYLDFGKLDALNLASASGHVDILRWWTQRFPDMPIPYSNRALDIASRNGHVQVLDWWASRQGQRPLKYSSAALHVTCTRQGFATLRWWTRQQHLGTVTLPKLGTRMVHSLMDHGLVTLLAALHLLGLVPTETVDTALDIASYHGHVCILDWIVSTRPKSRLQYSDRAMLGASE